MTAPDDITPEEIAAIEARCDAANAKLARAVKLLRELDWTENHLPDDHHERKTALLAEIEAEHGK